MWSRVINFDLRCVTCGFNLRGLRVPYRCPECGSPIGPTINAAAKRETRLRRFLQHLQLGEPWALATLTVPFGLLSIVFAMLKTGLAPTDPLVYVTAGLALIPSLAASARPLSGQETFNRILFRLVAAYGLHLVFVSLIVLALAPIESASPRTTRLERRASIAAILLGYGVLVIWLRSAFEGSPAAERH